MEVNADMKKALRGGYTCCVPGCYSNTKSDTRLSFHKFPWDVSLGEKWVNFIKRIDFIPAGPHRAHSIFMEPKSKADQTSLLYFHFFLSPNRESLQKYVCHSR